MNLDIKKEHFDAITQILQNDGLSKEDIDIILNGTYQNYSSKENLPSPIFENKEYFPIIQALSEDYTLEKIPISHNINENKINDFKKILKDNNLTIDNIKALYRYSCGSNMILSAKRNKDLKKETISQGIDKQLDSTLIEYGIQKEFISKIHNYIDNLDYSKPLHENWKTTTDFLEQFGIPKKFKATINSAVMHKNSLAHLDKTLLDLDQCLTTNLKESINLTRAIKSSFLTSNLKSGEDLTSLIGKKIEETGYSSTSPIYDSSFAKYDDFDVVYDIYAPIGTQGISITPFSVYDNTEEEILLNSNDMYIIDVIPNVVDKNGKTKTILKTIVLSKDKTCYKGIGNTQTTKKELIEQYKNYRDKLSEAYSVDNSLTQNNEEIQEYDSQYQTDNHHIK
ncbi:MAG: hypothetical protein E7170_04750 [Firmicutes bacterium]|nr:hypothetical protein [Bacillota bacterium]